MKHGRWCLFIVASLAAGQARAESPRLELYADATRSACELVDNTTALRSVYVFYLGTPSATLVSFSTPKPSCWLGATWVGDITPYVGIGNSQTGWSVGFGLCLQPPVYVAQVNFFATGGSLPCCQVPISHGIGNTYEVEYIDCNFGTVPLAKGHGVVVNANDSCRCQQPLSTEPTTWGRVKAMYR